MKKRIWTVVFVSVLAFVMVGPASVAASQTVSGEVGEAYEIIADDGTVYTILDSEKGEELSKLVGETVTVTGTIEEADGAKSILVESFIVINK
jgi:hypothetical protein